MRREVCALAGPLVAAIALAGCEGKGRTPGPAELALVAQAFDPQLNAPAEAVRTALVRANADKRIYPQELMITDAEGPTPVDWLAYRQGLIKVAGVDSYSAGYFGLTPAGEAFAAAGQPRWLASRIQGEPQVNCAQTGAWTTCKVRASVAIGPTAQGAALFGQVAVPPAAIEGELQYRSGAWVAGEVATTDGSKPELAARKALFGDATAIAKARNAFALEVNRQVR